MAHPIVRQMDPSPEQQRAINALAQDIVVTAGAGTGKTRTLVARYLSLIARGVPLRSIVAITFTRKAAREMRNRIREEIRRYLEQIDSAGGERGRWQSLYAELDAARIGTIHSLCTEILRAHPAEAMVDPRFEVLGEGQVNILRARAVDEALGWAADDEDAVRLFSLLGERDLRDALLALLRQRLDARESPVELPQDALSRWQEALARWQARTLDEMLHQREWREAARVVRENAAEDAQDRMEVQRRAALVALEDAACAEETSQQVAALARLDGINLRGGRRVAWPRGEVQLGAVKGALRSLREHWRARAGILQLSLSPLDEALAGVLPALWATFDFACRRYAAFKEERNGLDFDDLEGGALALLEQHASVRKRWQQEIQAVLVDEFQDTNARQRDLILLLRGDGGDLFFVGDAKQSIYRFRGADVTVFRAERERMEAEDGSAFPLACSYRAHVGLVEGLNHLLRPVLGLEADPHRPWVEPFSPLEPHREQAGSGFVAPHIELHLAVGSKGEGALDRAADALVGRIVELVEGDTAVAEDGQFRPLEYGHVAILCRATKSFAPYEDALERAGVPFLTVAGRGFYGRPEVRDLLNALQALADPTDDLALAGLLRSPAFALSDAGLYRLCAAREGDLWTCLQEAGAGLPGEDGRRAARAAHLIADLNGQVGRSPVAEVLKAFLDATCYRAALIRAGQARGARNVSKLLADAHESGLVGVGEFLEYVDSLRDTGTREGEARVTAEGAVQVMTVHAAKGLEFPVVALGDAGYSPRGGDGLLLDLDTGVVLPLKGDDEELPAAYRLAKHRAGDQEAAEEERLLYVAATRASEKLLISGCVALKKDGRLGKMKGWLGQIAESVGLTNREIVVDKDGTGVLHVDLRVGRAPVFCALHEPAAVPPVDRSPEEVVREAAVVLPPPLLERVQPPEEMVDQRTRQQDRVPPQRIWRVVPAVERAGAPAWVVGSLVHEALAGWLFPGEGFGHWARARARGYGIADAGQLSDAVDQSRQLLQRFRDHPLYLEMDGAERRLHEVPYSRVVDGRVEYGLIDVLFLRRGLWTVVEFKTDEVSDAADFRRVLAEKDYLGQVRGYVQAVEAMLGRRPRSILCMLNYDKGIRLQGVDEPDR